MSIWPILENEYWVEYGFFIGFVFIAGLFKMQSYKTISVLGFDSIIE